MPNQLAPQAQQLTLPELANVPHLRQLVEEKGLAAAVVTGVFAVFTVVAGLTAVIVVCNAVVVLTADVVGRITAIVVVNSADTWIQLKTQKHKCRSQIQNLLSQARMPSDQV